MPPPILHKKGARVKWYLGRVRMDVLIFEVHDFYELVL